MISLNEDVIYFVYNLAFLLGGDGQSLSAGKSQGVGVGGGDRGGSFLVWLKFRLLLEHDGPPPLPSPAAHSSHIPPGNKK